MPTSSPLRALFRACGGALLLAAPVLLPVAGRAQTAAQAPSAAPRAGGITLKIMPLALADPWMPTFRAGAEYRLSPAWSVEASYGIQMRNLGWGTGASGLANNRYHTTHIETRRYLQPLLTGTGFYVAAAAFQVRQQYDIGAGTFYDGTQTMAFSGARVRRTITGGVLKAGVVVALDAHWRLDLALGAGVRHGRIAYAAQELRPLDPALGLMYDDLCGFGIDFSPTTTPGTFRRTALAVDIKLGYALFR